MIIRNDTWKILLGNLNFTSFPYTKPHYILSLTRISITNWSSSEGINKLFWVSKFSLFFPSKEDCLVTVRPQVPSKCNRKSSRLFIYLRLCASYDETKRFQASIMQCPQKFSCLMMQIFSIYMTTLTGMRVPSKEKYVPRIK